MLQVFNSGTKYLQKECAASNVEASRRADYLRDEVAARLSDRLLDISRHFPKVLDLGANACNIARLLTQDPPTPSDPSVEEDPRPHQPKEPIKTRIGHLTAADTSPTLLHRDADLPFNDLLPLTRHSLLSQEEHLPFDDASFNAVLSSLSLHWTNDLPSLLTQVNRILTPDSPFIAAMFGGDTLFELRTSLQLCSMERRGGIAAHTSPLADVRDVGGLLTRAGFKMLTVDVDDIVVDYPDVFALMQDLQAMGESNALLTREMSGLRRDVMLGLNGVYKELHGNEDGTIPATFRIIFMIGWTEGEGQAKPLPRGSGELNMKDFLEGGIKEKN